LKYSETTTYKILFIWKDTKKYARRKSLDDRKRSKTSWVVGLNVMSRS